jgi:hypothetical protein
MKNDYIGRCPAFYRCPPNWLRYNYSSFPTPGYYRLYVVNVHIYPRSAIFSFRIPDPTNNIPTIVKEKKSLQFKFNKPNQRVAINFTQLKFFEKVKRKI